MAEEQAQLLARFRQFLPDFPKLKAYIPVPGTLN